MAAMLRWCVGGQEQKYFSPLGTKHYFHANSSEKFHRIDHRHTTNMAALYAWVVGTLRYSGRGRGGRQPEVKCSILGIISIMPQRRPEVATVKTRSLAAS